MFNIKFYELEKFEIKMNIILNVSFIYDSIDSIVKLLTRSLSIEFLTSTEYHLMESLHTVLVDCYKTFVSKFRDL